MSSNSPKRLEGKVVIVTGAGSVGPGWGNGRAVASNWYGMMGSAGTPPDVVKRVNEALRRTLDHPGVRTNLEQLGLVPAPGSAAEFTTLIRNDTAKWGRVVKEHNIHGE